MPRRLICGRPPLSLEQLSPAWAACAEPVGTLRFCAIRRSRRPNREGPRIGSLVWGQLAQKKRNQRAFESEKIVDAILSVPRGHLSAVVNAVQSGVLIGAIAPTPYDSKPAVSRLTDLSFQRPGAVCQQCGSPLSQESSDNNCGPGICWLCWER